MIDKGFDSFLLSMCIIMQKVKKRPKRIGIGNKRNNRDNLYTNPGT
jgi:hypothetical protein